MPAQDVVSFIPVKCRFCVDCDDGLKSNLLLRSICIGECHLVASSQSNMDMSVACVSKFYTLLYT